MREVFDPGSTSGCRFQGLVALSPNALNLNPKHPKRDPKDEESPAASDHSTQAFPAAHFAMDV